MSPTITGLNPSQVGNTKLFKNLYNHLSLLLLQWLHTVSSDRLTLKDHSNLSQLGFHFGSFVHRFYPS